MSHFVLFIGLKAEITPVKAESTPVKADISPLRLGSSEERRPSVTDLKERFESKAIKGQSPVASPRKTQAELSPAPSSPPDPSEGASPGINSPRSEPTSKIQDSGFASEPTIHSPNPSQHLVVEIPQVEPPTPKRGDIKPLSPAKTQIKQQLEENLILKTPEMSPEPSPSKSPAGLSPPVSPGSSSDVKSLEPEPSSTPQKSPTPKQSPALTPKPPSPKKSPALTPQKSPAAATLSPQKSANVSTASTPKHPVTVVKDNEEAKFDPKGKSISTGKAITGWI